MSVDVTEATFDEEVVERSRQVPVVVDFWADWCGPCKALSPALERAEAGRAGKVVLAKVDVEANQRLAAAFRVQGIPAVKAFRDGKVVDEFTGALPSARVEAFFDGLVPSRADELLAKGDELSLREAAELQPGRAAIAVLLAKARLERGAEEEALEAVRGHEADFAAAGIEARIRLARAGIGSEAFAALDRGDRRAALDALLAAIAEPPAGTAPNAAARARDLDPAEVRDLDPALARDLDPAEVRDLLRRAIVGILSDLDPADPLGRTYRRKLAAALG